MRDYYRDFVTKNSRNTQFTEPTKPTKAPSARFVGSVPKEYSENSHPYDGFVGSVSNEYSKNSTIEVYDGKQYQHIGRNEIFEERIAVMMYDGGLSEVEAIQYLIANPEYTADFDG